MPDVDDGSSHGMRRYRPVLHWIWLALAVVLGFFLLTEHRAHLFGVLPFLLVLLCPLMHLLMHRGHDGHRSDPAMTPARISSRKARP